MNPDYPYGFDVHAGYRGRMPDGTWMLFSTQKEYTERFYDEVRDAIDSDQNQNS